MERQALVDLERWLASADRRPLVVRGARQVGKIWLVREFAERVGRELLELNFERDPADASLFADRDPRTAIQRLEARFGQGVDPASVLASVGTERSPERFRRRDRESRSAPFRRRAFTRQPWFGW